MTFRPTVLALWLTLLMQVALAVAPQGATIWLACLNPACAGVASSADRDCCGGCCEDEGEGPAAPEGGTDGVRPLAPCCVALVFPGSRGQPVADPEVRPLPSPAALLPLVVALRLPPVDDAGAEWLAYHEDGRPPPVAGLAVTSRLRL